MFPESSATEIAAQLERASRLIHSAGHAQSLYPAQWSALRFFADAPPASRTTAALARFQGMNLGPVARTVRTLVEKGLLARSENPQNRRADLLSLTPAGTALLEKDPRKALVTRLAALTPEQRSILATALDQLLKDLFHDWKGVDGLEIRDRLGLPVE